MADFDISQLPLPKDIGLEQQSTELHLVSVIFNKMQANETIKISDEATTPMWLKKTLYTKLVQEDETPDFLKNAATR